MKYCFLGSKLITTTNRKSSRKEALYSETCDSLLTETGVLRADNCMQYELAEPSSHDAAAAADALAEPAVQSKSQAEKDKKRRAKATVVVEHLDIIKDEFWDRRPWILSGKPGQPGKAFKEIQT